MNVEIRSGSYFSEDQFLMHESELPQTMETVERLILQPISSLNSKMRQLNSGAIDFNYISVNSFLELIVACSECTCSNSRTIISWGDTSDPEEIVNERDLCYETTQTHFYASKGVFPVCVTVANDLSNESFCRELHVLMPVPPKEQIGLKTAADCSGTGTSFIALGSDVCFQVSFPGHLSEVNFPSEFTITVEYKYRIQPDLSESIIVSSYTANQMWNFTETFEEAGLFDARVSLFNEGSFSLLYLKLGVYEIISQCDTNITWKFPQEAEEIGFLKMGSATSDSGVLGYDKEMHICFFINKDTSPESDDLTVITCQGQHDSSNLFMAERISNNLICFPISQNDTYDCHINVSNKVSQCSDRHTIKVDKPIKGFMPVSYNVFLPDVLGKVGFSTFDNGQKMCVLIYCSANCSTNFIITYFQEGLTSSACESSSYYNQALAQCGSKCYRSSQMFSSTTPDLYEVPPQQAGSIEIQYTAWNSISLVRMQKYVAVTSESCNYPDLKIVNAGEHYYEPITLFKKAPAHFEGEIFVVCRETDLNQISWCFMRYNELNGEIVEMNNSTERLYGHLDDICTPIYLESAAKSTLTLSEDFLRNISYGQYRFVFKVTMQKPEGSQRAFDFSSYESNYVRFVPSGLVGRMFEDVSEISVSKGQKITLSPELYSYDPDDPSLVPFNFKWWCRNVKESFKMDLKGNWRDDYPPFLESYEFPGAAGGCDGNGPGIFDALTPLILSIVFLVKY